MAKKQSSGVSKPKTGRGSIIGRYEPKPPKTAAKDGRVLKVMDTIKPPKPRKNAR